ncbi:hypothetical protein AB6N23_12385 [Cellulomonas sp. 179-A 9B4 NHS]|uniref:hypothetical protein n=1 Tax=Cellulomonas sp. 179-A 9B4 NHS TaxID=3142379 RepID=UPI00399F2633
MTAHDLSRALPDVPAVRTRCLGLAALDAVLSPEWEARWHSFDARWSDDEAMASMRNGQGDEWSIVFGPAGAFLRGFDHESQMSPFRRGGRPFQGVLDAVPEVFATAASEPAFTLDGTYLATVCLWRRAGDTAWQVGPVPYPPGDDPDGADFLFELLVADGPGAYVQFASDYYEVDLAHRDVAHVLAAGPLSEPLVRRLNPDVSLRDLEQDLRAMGYPSSG